MPRVVPPQDRWESEQVVATPRLFIQACELKWGAFDLDLAADANNTVCPLFIGEKEDSLICNWTRRLNGGLGWLNPPFSLIRPWVRKCAEETLDNGSRVIMLVPGSISSKWFEEYALPKASFIMGVRPKLAFGSHLNQYPKDLAVMGFGFGTRRQFGVFAWKRLLLERGIILKHARSTTIVPAAE